MAIGFISPSRQLHLNRVQGWVGTTIVHDVRVGPLFVWYNPVGENKSLRLLEHAHEAAPQSIHEHKS